MSLSVSGSCPQRSARHVAIPGGRRRIGAIDALRGFVMLLMLVDHTREFFYLDSQVSDPMSVETTEPALFFTRLLAHLCAPIFVALTGLSAWLHAANRGGGAAASGFLVKRGLFLVALELTVINFAWTFDPSPPVMFLQVIWAIGVAMIALAAIVRLPRAAIFALGLVIVLGHNLLDPVVASAGAPGHDLWAVLHDRGYITLPGGGQARTSYPVLPWIGVIALGYAAGPWFAPDTPRGWRWRALATTALVAVTGFVIVRAMNGYGDPTPWHVGSAPLMTAMSFLNVTKYPPSADFLLLTLGIGAGLLIALETLPRHASSVLAALGAAPLFFYVLHLYLLHGANRISATIAGREGLISAPDVGSLWLIAAVTAVPCWFACRWFGAVKRSSDNWWIRYL